MAPRRSRIPDCLETIFMEAMCVPHARGVPYDVLHAQCAAVLCLHMQRDAVNAAVTQIDAACGKSLPSDGAFAPCHDGNLEASGLDAGTRPLVFSVIMAFVAACTRWPWTQGDGEPLRTWFEGQLRAVRPALADAFLAFRAALRTPEPRAPMSPLHAWGSTAKRSDP